jgi:protein O-mannosyl-transferase
MQNLTLKNRWVVWGLLSGICFLAYSNSLHNPFMVDDHTIFSDVKLKNIKFLLNSFIFPSQDPHQGADFTGSGDYYRPMAYVISMLTYLAFGDQPFGYHVLNLFLFTLMCFTLYVFIELFFKDRILALVTGILFAVHPINVLFVNYNTSGIHSVRFVFMFLSLIFFLKVLDGSHKNIFYFISLLCFAVTLLCHETSIVLPFYILFVSVFVSGNDVKRAVFKTWPYFLMLLLYLFFRLLCTRLPGQLSINLTHQDPSRLVLTIAAFSKVIYLYSSKLFFPDVVYLGWNVLLTGKFMFVWTAGLVILLAGWYRLFRADAKGMPFFCATWMMLGFLPVTVACLASPKLGLIIEPQWLTFSSVGFFLYIAWAGLKLYAGINKRLAWLLFISLLMIFMSITRHNNWIWGDEIRYYDYWQENIEGFNRSHGNDFVMGNIYLEKKNYYLARYYYRKVARSGLPAYTAAVYSNLGLIDLHQGNSNQAKEDFLISIKSNPNNAFVLNNLAIIYKDQLNYAAARSLLLRALELDKYSIEARLNLAYIYEKESNYKEAVRIYNENLNIVPYEERSLLALVEDYLRWGDAISAGKYSRLLIEHSTDPVILTELGSLLAGSGQFSLASDAFSQALRMDPKYKLAYLEAGTLLANAQKYSEAIRLWQIGEGIDPKDQRFKDNIAEATALQSGSVSR